MYNIGICDDGKNVCTFLEEEVREYIQGRKIAAQIHIWYSGAALCEYLKKGEEIDLLYLDIELEDQINGIQVADYIRNHLENRGMQIVYISGKQSYAQELFKTQPMDFLVKPFSRIEIQETLKLAFKLLQRDLAKFRFQTGKEYHSLSYEEIVYFASEGRKIKIKTIHGEQEFYGKLKDVDHVSYFTYEEVQLDNGLKLTISQANRKQVRERLLRGL